MSAVKQKWFGVLQGEESIAPGFPQHRQLKDCVIARFHVHGSCSTHDQLLALARFWETAHAANATHRSPFLNTECARYLPPLRTLTPANTTAPPSFAPAWPLPTAFNYPSPQMTGADRRCALLLSVVSSSYPTLFPRDGPL